ncbi:tetratricopeptide repeat protein [Poriferisphaera sp. WC338]|uniref:tetratricopeptide repeat protein n=1 Tax=Poriferisphaera sp. WC338 TaxID=3425129 RepID=UPI003D81808D
MQQTKLGWLVLVAMGGMMLSCASNGIEDGEKVGAHGAIDASKKVRVWRVVREHVALPPGRSSEKVKRLEGDAFAKANMSYADALGSYKMPADLLAPGVVDEKIEEVERDDVVIVEGQVGAIDLEIEPWRGSNAFRESEGLEHVEVEVGELPDLKRMFADEPSLAAQRAYVAGRMAWNARNLGEAKRQLEIAMKEAGDAPEVMRLLGLVYTLSGNKVKGAQLLRRVVRLNPDDLESLYLVGRHEIAAGRMGTGAAVLGHVLEKIEAGDGKLDRAIPPLGWYYLGTALTKLGHLRAGLYCFEQFADPSMGYGSRSVYGREFAFLLKQRGKLLVAMGDGFHQLGEPDHAAQAYVGSKVLGVQHSGDFSARMIYTLLMLGDDEGAMSELSNLLKQTKESGAVVVLAKYMVGQGIKEGVLIEYLRGEYEGADRPSEAAVVLSTLMPGDTGKAFILSHLRESEADDADADSGGDVMALNHYLQMYVLGKKEAIGGREPSADLLAESVLVSAGVMETHPEKAGEVARGFLREIQHISELKAAVEGLDIDQRQRAMVQLIYGLTLAVQNNFGGAAEAFGAAHEREPEVLAPRLELVKTMLVLKDYDKAGVLLDEVADRSETEIVTLRVRLLMAKQSYEQAVRVLDEAGNRGNTDIELMLEKANLMVLLKREQDAERVLLDALNRYPKEEKAYSAMFALYRNSGSRLENVGEKTQKLFGRLVGAIPNSRLARLSRAEWYEGSKKYREAEMLLLQLLQQDGKDYDVMGRLLRVYVKSKQIDRGKLFVSRQLEKMPKDGQVRQLAVRFYREVGDEAAMYDVLLGLVKDQPAGTERDVQLGRLYFEMKRYEDAFGQLRLVLDGREHRDFIAVARLTFASMIQIDGFEGKEAVVWEAMARYPDEAGDIGFVWGLMLDQNEQEAAGEAFMLKVLAKHPKHGPTNNQVGYQWIMAGKNLEQAKAMIARALADEPDNEAYQDSMGWAEYKLGAFDAAVTWLEKAVNHPQGQYPVIFDHLGDAKYRAGDKEGAVKAWRMAKQMMITRGDEFRGMGDPEMVGLEGRLDEKVKRAVAGEAVRTALLPGENAAVVEEKKPATKEVEVEIDETGNEAIDAGAVVTLPGE